MTVKGIKEIKWMQGAMAVLVLLVGLYLPAVAQAKLEPTSAESLAIAEDFGRMPLTFIRNDGQLDGQVKYYQRGLGHVTFFTSEGVTLSLAPQRHAVSVVKLSPLGANKQPVIRGEEAVAGKINYFVGEDATAWQQNIPAYQAVRYEALYSGIDLRFYGKNGELEYDLIVEPGADPEQVAFAYEGVEALRVSEAGELEVLLASGSLKQKRPVVYQQIEDRRIEVASRFRLLGDTAYGFELGSYDPAYPLIIDPILDYSTYLSGSNHDHGHAIAVDALGNAYITGETLSLDFPTMTAYQAVATADYHDVFVSKMNATGNALVYSTYLGGSNHDRGYGIAVDSAGNAYVTGRTGSDDFPVVSAIQPSKAPGYDDAFVAKLDASGGSLLYSTYVGGSKHDYAEGIAVDSAGNVYIAGNTRSSDFPTVNPLYTSIDTGNNRDAFVAKINASGTAYVYSTYLGGENRDQAIGIAVDGSGNAYVTGSTESDAFPTTLTAFDKTHDMGFTCAFVSKISPAGDQLLYSTYLGGINDDIGRGIAVDGNENAYLVGSTRSSNFPTANPLYTAADTGNNNDVFVARVDTLASGVSSLVYSTYLGGDNRDIGYAIAVTATGEAYVTGRTRSLNFPVTGAPFQSVNGGDEDAFVAKFNADGSALLYSSFLGGSNEDEGRGIAIDAAGSAYITGETRSTDFPMLNPYQASGAVNYRDAFVTKVQ